jgi:RNA:NAD 2'-phosphotransferase (TPT1/KptA family)
MDKESINVVFNGTYKELYEAICRDGLQAIYRNHNEIAKSLDIESSKHKNSIMKVYIDMRELMNEGIIFYVSQNGVVLKEGQLSPKYLRFETI